MRQGRAADRAVPQEALNEEAEEGIGKARATASQTNSIISFFPLARSPVQRGARAVFLVGDICRKESLHNISYQKLNQRLSAASPV